MNLAGNRVALRPGTPEDLDRLTQILGEPEVAKRWVGLGETSEEIAQQFVGSEAAFVVTLEGEVIGAIQFAEEDDPMYRQAGIDVLLTTARHGEGLGSDAVRTVARYLIDHRGHHRLSIDPAADNHAAIRAYERVGFRPVGVLRRYERGPDGTWHDGMLMDLLAEELREREDPAPT